MRFQSIVVFLAVFLCLNPAISLAQRTYPTTSPEFDYARAFELYEREKYGAAQKQFRKIIEDLSGEDSELRTNSEYYAALCSVFLFQDDSELHLNRFIAGHPESMKSRQAVWEMALFQYNSKKYRKATGYFERVDMKILSGDQEAEYYFKKGYSYFMKNDFEKANLAFYEIKDVQSDYTGPAIYYYGYIAYTRENFETALIEFKRLENDENFSGIVPYYILQIYYKQEKYQEIITYGPDLLKQAVPGRVAEIARFIGDAYYQLENYEESRYYLELYVEKSRTITREDRHQMGYLYYQLGEYEKAIPYFEGVGGRKDPLGQNAHYLLGDCFLRAGDKAKAGIAFFNAANMDFDPDIREDALFNYAKITYELDFSPFNEAIRAFERYIELYPYSERLDEAYQFLVMAYLNTRNYSQAYESLRKVRTKTSKIREAYQRVAFYRGLELYSNLKFEEAIDLFQTALEQGSFDQSLIARSEYWIGEAYYRLRDYQEAIDHYNEFLVSPGAFSQGEYSIASYNIGYCYFDLKRYAESGRWFRRYLDQVRGKRGRIVADAYNRLGDCAFMAQDYPLSIRYYDQSINLKTADPDYALFQKSFANGLLKKHFEKISGLTELQNSYPKSGYLDDAIFERGKSYVKIEKLDPALQDFKEILERFPNSSYYAKAMLEIGLVYYNQNKNQEAIRAYKDLIQKFQGTPESRSALTGLRTVYVDMNDVESYFSYVRTLGSFANVSLSEQDSLTYQTGENLYMAGDCDRALPVLNGYIDKFGDGSFILNAHFYRAECLASRGQIKDAIVDYSYVISRPKNVFSEPSLLAASAINFNEKNWMDALENYVHLETVADIPENKRTAIIGQLRCMYELENYSGVVSIGPKILSSGKVTEELAREVYFKMGKAHLINGNRADALEAFRQVAKEILSAEGAESKYQVAQILFQQGNIDDASKEVTEFINMNTPHQNWMARIFILSSDISLEQNDLFQARYTLQSLIDYYEVEDDGVKEQARARLQAITDLEEFEKEQSEPDTIRGGLTGIVQGVDQIKSQ